MFILRLIYRVLLLIAVLIGIALAVVVYYIANPKLPDYVPVEQVHYLDQWDAADRQTYYFTPQGTQVKGLRYEWFSALELPLSSSKFADVAYTAVYDKDESISTTRKSSTSPKLPSSQDIVAPEPVCGVYFYFPSQ